VYECVIAWEHLFKQNVFFYSTNENVLGIVSSLLKPDWSKLMMLFRSKLVHLSRHSRVKEIDLLSTSSWLTNCRLVTNFEILLDETPNLLLNWKIHEPLAINSSWLKPTSMPISSAQRFKSMSWIGRYFSLALLSLLKSFFETWNHFW
jgi:hypothetical protein